MSSVIQEFGESSVKQLEAIVQQLLQRETELNKREESLRAREGERPFEKIVNTTPLHLSTY